jgi:hypothetical protein
MRCGRIAMTQRELKKMYGAFFKAEGLVAKWGFQGPCHVIATHEGCDYNVVLSTWRRSDGLHRL